MTNTTRLCSADGCSLPHDAKGYCNKHYKRMKRTGTLRANKVYRTPDEALAGRSERRGNCIIWTGAKDSTGYGSIGIRGRKKTYVHRYAWERANGPIPEGHHIDHLCFNRDCINPEHLRAVTQAQNNQNRKPTRPDVGSGIRGVCWHKRSGKWMARVQVGGKAVYGGVYADKEEAGRVAAEMRAQLMTHSQN